MKSFLEWMNERVLREESSEERAAREREAERRERLWDDYAEKAKAHKLTRPPGPFNMSPEWTRHARTAPKSPTEEFRQRVEEEIEKLTGLSMLHGEIIDSTDGAKQDADESRILELIEDSWDDGTSPEETAKMAVELMRSMGYLRGN